MIPSIDRNGVHPIGTIEHQVADPTDVSSGDKHHGTLERRATRTICRTMAAMGFNPFRSQEKSKLDIALVVGFVLVTLALVAWGFWGQ